MDKQQEAQEMTIQQLSSRYMTVLERLDNRSIFSILVDELKRLKYNDRILIDEATERVRKWK